MSGFIQIPRSLTRHPAVTDAPIAQRWVLIMLIEGAAFLPCEFCDHGKMMKIQPGQIVITRRGFAKHIKAKEMDVRRALERFSECGILTQEVTHTKTLITIKHKETYDLIKQYSDPRFAPKVTQDLQKSDPEKDIEQDNKIRTKKINKEKISIREWVSLSQDEIDKIFHLHGDKLANQMLDILDAYNTKRQEGYKSDYGALKMGGWVYKEASNRNTPKTPYNSKSVDRRTLDIDNNPVENQYAGRF